MDRKGRGGKYFISVKFVSCKGYLYSVSLLGNIRNLARGRVKDEDRDDALTIVFIAACIFLRYDHIGKDMHAPGRCRCACGGQRLSTEMRPFFRTPTGIKVEFLVCNIIIFRCEVKKSVSADTVYKSYKINGAPHIYSYIRLF